MSKVNNKKEIAQLLAGKKGKQLLFRKRRKNSGYRAKDWNELIGR